MEVLEVDAYEIYWYINRRVAERELELKIALDKARELRSIAPTVETKEEKEAREFLEALNRPLPTQSYIQDSEPK